MLLAIHLYTHTSFSPWYLQQQTVLFPKKVRLGG